MKALLVTYCPRGARSRTRKLVDNALDVLLARKVSIEQLDLCKDVPALFTPDKLAVYYERNYAGQKISAAQELLMKDMDRMTVQLKNADLLVLAYPMYNFSQPAIVKAWIDSVMQKGETWDIKDGGYIGLMKGRKALILSSSGGVYDGGMENFEHSMSLSKCQFLFMGYEVESVSAAGMSQLPEKEQEILLAARKRVTAVLERWSA